MTDPLLPITVGPDSEPPPAPLPKDTTEMKPKKPLTIDTVTSTPVLLGLLLVLLGYAFFKSSKFCASALAFRSFDSAQFGGVLAGLIAVAIFIERAIEVFTMITRDAGADALQGKLTQAQNKVNAAQANVAKSAANSVALLQAAQTALDNATDALNRYRAETKEYAMKGALVLGFFASFVGVRSVHALLADSANPGKHFALFDIVITSLLLAGGSAGIHQLANVYNSFMDGASSNLDAQAAANTAAAAQKTNS